jgi:hypothetical protein
MAKRIVNIRLRPDQEEGINAIVDRSAILDTSKFVRIAVDWLLRSDIGEVIKKIVHDEAFPDYRIPKKSAGFLRSRLFCPGNELARWDISDHLFRTLATNASVLPGATGQADGYSAE